MPDRLLQKALIAAFAICLSGPARGDAATASASADAAIATTTTTAAPSVDFLRDVRPILSSQCFKCHGPDAGTRKGGLRLDEREDALAPAKSGERAIVPGNPDASELLRRVFSEDESEVMPPPSTKRTLSAEQKETLRRWIAEGAEYAPHWAFVPPTKTPPPVLDGVTHPIDAFIQDRLGKEGLRPSPEADRLTLVRRVYLDLIGLPPTAEEADAFAQDEDPCAYERLVDRLLASPRYGERWARRWMDLARYADTNGYEKDRVRSMWPWRDWLIRALNADMPFDQFTIEQIAGDMLPGATLDQRIATGFHRNTMINEEGGIDPLEYRFHAMVDRVHTTATAWLGMTMACAQCHTHKFDPIQHEEYYRFMAYLDNADEPVLTVPSPEIAARRRPLERRIAELEASLLDRFPPEDAAEWHTPLAVEFVAESGATAERLPDGSYRLTGPTPGKDVYTLTFDTRLANITSINLDALADDALPSKGPGRAGNGNFVLSELIVTAAPLGSAEEGTKASFAEATADFEQNGFPAANAVDGRADTGWAIHGEGAWNRNRRATFRFREPIGHEGGTRLKIQLRQEYGSQHVLGRFRISLGVDAPGAKPVEERRAARLARAMEQWEQRERERQRSWTALRPLSATSSVPVLTIESDGSVFASSDQTKSDRYDLRFSSDLKGITAIRLEALPDDRLPAGGPGRVYYEGPFGDFFLSTITLSRGEEKVVLTRPSQSFASGGNDAAKALDDDAQSGWSINGGQGRRHVAVFNLEKPLDDASDLRLSLLFEKYYAAGLGRFRVSVTTDPRGAEASALPDGLALDKPREARTPEEQEALRREFAMAAPELASARQEIERLRRELPAYPTTLVMQERPPDNPRTTRIRHRGEFLQPKEEVTPGLPAIFAKWTSKAPRNRLEFARWLVSRENPLTARVTVNRQWQAFFGHGLVRTMEDFGFQGELPTHPELLDWLAVDFMDNGWSLKKLHRLIVTSATYRQSSHVTPELLERDPDNRLLARAPRFRVEAELVRDLALSAAGVLSPKIGGPSVFPPQIPSITKEGAYGPLEWVVSQGEDRYRRGLYTFMKRTAPYASFNAFDAPSGEACVARREASDTPLQALALLNDEVFVEAAQKLGKAAASLDCDEEGRIQFLFRRCLTRPASAEEAERIARFYRAQRERLARGELSPEDLGAEAGERAGECAAWTAVARALLNLDETVTRG